MNVAIILAGGSGHRMEQEIPKQFLNINDKPLIIYTLEAFEKHPKIDAILVVCIKGWHEVLKAYAKQFKINKLQWVIFIPQDINQEISIDEEITYIFHCASNTHPKAYASDPIGTIMTNIVGTNNLLKFAALNNVKRTVFLSSVEIYGENTGSISQFSETDLGYIDCNTVRAGYPEGKRAGESLCQAYISKWDMDIVISRICRVYGPTMLYNDSKALSQFIKNAVNKEDIVLKSDGLQHYSYCYVADTVSALLYILLYGVKGNAYNIADEKSDVLLKDLTLMLSSYVGTKVSYKLPDEIEKAGFSKATKALLNAQKLKQLGWNACYNLEDGLQRTLSILMDM